jgi:putative NADPH-quinone reductase
MLVVLGHPRDDNQPLGPDLVRAQQALLAARHVAWVYPVWWGTMPALLKGFLDRTLVSGFAYRYRPNSPLWDRLLRGRSAELLVTMDAPPEARQRGARAARQLNQPRRMGRRSLSAP